VPLSKMPRRVTGIGESLGNRFFLETKSVTMTLNSSSPIRSPSQNRSASRRANRRSGIKPIKPKPTRCHRIKIRRFQNRVVVVTRLPPALVVRHHQNDIRLGRINGSGTTRLKSGCPLKYTKPKKKKHRRQVDNFCLHKQFQWKMARYRHQEVSSKILVN